MFRELSDNATFKNRKKSAKWKQEKTEITSGHKSGYFGGGATVSAATDKPRTLSNETAHSNQHMYMMYS